MGNGVGGAGSRPVERGYVPTGSEVVGTVPATTTTTTTTTTAVPGSTDGVDPSRRSGGTAGPAGTGGALAAPAPRRLQDIARTDGDTAAAGMNATTRETPGIHSFGDFLIAILEFFAEVFSFGQYDSRTFNGVSVPDRQRITEGGRSIAAGIYDAGNGDQFNQFIVRSGTPPAPEMQGTPPLVRVSPRLREAVEAEVRQAYTGPDGRLTISEQDLRVRVDSMMRGIREEMTARLNGGTSVTGPAAAGGAAAPTAPVRTETSGRPTAAFHSALLARADSFRAEHHPRLITPDQASAVRADLHAAAEAEAAGRYDEAAAIYQRLGLPTPAPVPIEPTPANPPFYQIPLDENSPGFRTMLVIGAIDVTYSPAALASRATAGYSTSFSDDARSPSATSALAFNRMNGLAHRAVMMDHMAAMGTQPAPLAYPPTEAQCRDYMRRVGEANRGNPEAIMRAAQEVVNGTVVHYSAAGSSRDPEYTQNPHRFMLTDPTTGAHEFFDTEAAATARRTELNHGRTGADRVGAPRETGSSSPMAWEPRRAGGGAIPTDGDRLVGDCDLKRARFGMLLEAAGATPRMAADSVNPHGGHAYGVYDFNNPPFTRTATGVTSNEDFRMASSGSIASGSDIEGRIYELTRYTYGERPGSGRPAGHTYTFALGPTAPPPLSTVELTRRAGEMRHRHVSDSI